MACIHTHTHAQIKHVRTHAAVHTRPQEFLTSALLFGLWSEGAAPYHSPPTSTFVQVCLYLKTIHLTSGLRCLAGEKTCLNAACRYRTHNKSDLSVEYWHLSEVMVEK